MKRPVFLIVWTRRDIARLMLILLLVALAVKFGLNGLSSVCFGTGNLLRGKKIVIDPGHGGVDSGTNCFDFVEKEINLAVAKKLRAELTRLGAKVILTRQDDLDLSQLNPNGESTRHKRGLQARVSIINKNQPGVFLSIHVNAHYRRPSTSGSIVFYRKNDPGSRRLSTILQHHLNRVTEKHNLQKHLAATAEFYVLRHSTRTGAILELGFMTNPREKELLKQDQYQWELTKGIVEGLKEYFADLNT